MPIDQPAPSSRKGPKPLTTPAVPDRRTPTTAVPPEPRRRPTGRPLTGRATPFWRRACLLIGVSLVLLVNVIPAMGGDRPFNHAANWGGTGLMETPTARILDDGVMRIGFAQALPYRWYHGGMGVLPRFEVSGRYTEITNQDIEGPEWEGYGHPKDKAFDFKCQLLPESKWLPAVAFGMHDFHGTRLFEAQYLVASRQFYPFDLTIGVGRGRLKGPTAFSVGSEAFGLFGGLEVALGSRVHLIAEYSPIQYEDDRGAAAVPEGAASPVNAGLRVEALPGLELGLTYQRGDTVGFTCDLQFEIGVPITPKRPDPPLWHPVDRRTFAADDLQPRIAAIQQAIRDKGFRDVAVYTDGRDLTAEFENAKYLSHPKAAGRVLRILLFHSPVDTRNLVVILKKRQMPFLEVRVVPRDLEKYLFGEITHAAFAGKIRFTTTDRGLPDRRDELISSVAEPTFNYHLGVKPAIQVYLNDPSGALKSRVGVEPNLSANLWRGGAATAWYDIPLYSDIESSNEPLDDAVRSDSWRYMGRSAGVERLLYDQVVRLTPKTFGRLSTGYFDRMYAGAGGEVLTFLGEGAVAVGVEGDWARKREPGSAMDLTAFEVHSTLGNLYWHYPDLAITVQAQYGRFLAGDVGWRFEASREYANGVEIGAWYSLTDTDDLSAFNRDYHDKGVFLRLPARVFFDYETNTRYHYALSPWTRDVAQTVSHWTDLFRLGSDLMPLRFKARLNELRR